MAIVKTANFPRDVIYGQHGFSFPFSVGEDDWLISIAERNRENVKPEKPFARVLFMKFNDTEKAETEAGRIMPDEALEVANFIKEAKAAQKNVWVNCHAGICRSGAIVSLLIDLGWEYADSSLSPSRIPNWFVYNAVRKHFPELKQSWDKPDLTDIWIAAKGW